MINIIASHKHSTPKLAVQDLKIGLPALLTCIEMAIFATLHIYTYSHKPYCTDKSAYVGGTLGWRAFVDAYNPFDLVVLFRDAIQWLSPDKKQTEWHSHSTLDTVPNLGIDHGWNGDKEGVRMDIKH